MKNEERYISLIKKKHFSKYFISFSLSMKIDSFFFSMEMEMKNELKNLFFNEKRIFNFY